MPNEKKTKFAMSISELDKLLDLIDKLSTAVSKAITVPKEQRREMRKAIGDTCALIDEVLRSVKKRLGSIMKQLRSNDPDAKDSIASLAYAEEWENMYRLFKLCNPLREAASEIRENVLGRLVSSISFKNINQLREATSTFFATEAQAGEFVSNLLRNLTPLSDKVDTEKDFVSDELEKAIDAIQSYQDKFIALEQKLGEKI